MGSDVDEQQTRLQQSSNLWRLLVLCTCATFLLVPQLMTLPYGWLAHVNRFVSGESGRPLAKQLLVGQEHVLPSTNARAITPLGTRSGTVPDATQTGPEWRATDAPGPRRADAPGSTGAEESDCQNERLTEGSTPIDGAVSPCTPQLPR